MTTQIRTAGALFAGVLLLSAALPGTAFAVDGQIAITQAKAMAGSVTPGDAPGFPVSITQPGSYVLSSVLVVPDANTSAIVIAADHVTLDLNGFAILGPVDCSGGLLPCAGTPGNLFNGGRGVTTDAVRFNITIRNGTVQGMGGTGIRLEGDSHLVEYVHARSNGFGGISIIASNDRGESTVQYSTAQRNGSNPTGGPNFPPLSAGIDVDFGIVTHNIVDTNFTGISLGRGTLSHNVSSRNRNAVLVSRFVNFFGNTLNENVDDGLLFIFLTDGGQNLCDGSPCRF